MFDHCHYVPCLRWKMGEYKAMSLLSSGAANLITPLIEAPEKGYDFDTGADAKTIDAHLALFPKRVATSWGKRVCFIDLLHIAPSERMKGSVHPMTHMLDELDRNGCSAIPVIGPNRDAAYHRAVLQSNARKQRGLAIRLSLEKAAAPNLRTMLEALCGNGNPLENCDLILDLQAPNFTPLNGLAKLLTALIPRLPDLNRWRTFTVMGTSFPASMGDIKTEMAVIPRNEWLLYKLVIAALAKMGVRRPAFGDYAINFPDVLPKDMRVLKPSATIRYAIDDAWLIVKGRNVRDYKFAQFRSLSQTVRDHPTFLGGGFSHGSSDIAGCAGGTEGTGNLTVWRRVGTNQHLEKVAQDIASFSFL